MRIGWPGVLGLLILLGAPAACSVQPSAPEAVAAAPALPGYRAPAGAPAFCAVLARSPHLAGVAPAMGALAAEAGNSDARRRLADAAADLDAVLTETRRDHADAALDAALEDLVAALTSASHGSLAAGVPERVRAGLDTVGTLAQRVCEFPT